MTDQAWRALCADPRVQGPEDFPVPIRRELRDGPRDGAQIVDHGADVQDPGFRKRLPDHSDLQVRVLQSLPQTVKRREEKLQAIADRVARGRLIDEDKIGLAVGKVVNRWRVAKHFVLDIGPRRFTFQRNPESMEREAALAGVYVVWTDVPAQEMTAEEAVDNYRGLQQVEQAFRSVKTTHLNIRPLYHWTEDRARAHAFLCMLAYYVRWHMDKALEPIQHQPGYGSFRAVLEKLGTIQSNEIEVAGQRFDRITEPNADHQRILDLLGASIT